MSDTKHTLPPVERLTEEQLKSIGGGSCTIQDIQDGFQRLQESYDALVDFTSYVIERVATSVE
jgi:hypothetical protein